MDTASDRRHDGPKPGTQKRGPDARGARPAPKWVTILPIAALALVIATLFAPLTAIAAIPVIVALTVWHIIALLNTAGSIVPFAVLVGIDMLMLVFVVGMLVA